MFTEDTMKYEYMLHTWGGFYNKEYRDVHGYAPGYYWFETADERKKYVETLKFIERKLHAVRLMTVFEEGTETRYKTIAEMTFVYNGNEYHLNYDFGYCYEEDAARYMFEDGNYSCDCNRSNFIREQDESFPELDCGDLIQMKDFKVNKVIGTDKNFEINE